MFDKRKDNEISQASTPVEPLSNQPTTETFNTRSAAVIGQTITIKGSVTGDENLTIEGTVEGSIDLPNHDLTIGQSGQVTADLNANTIKVDGQVGGDINGAEKVVITKSGKVKGNIVAPRVTLEDGAKFKGSIDMDPGESAKPALKSTTSNSAPSATAPSSGNNSSGGKSSDNVKAAG